MFNWIGWLVVLVNGISKLVGCDTMAAFVSVCVGAGLRISLFWHETHTKGLKTRSPVRPEVEEGMKVSEKELTKEGRREQSAWDSCLEKDTVNRRRQWEDRSRAVMRWISIPSSFVEDSRKIHAEIAYKCTESCTKVSRALSPSCPYS